MTQPQFQSTSLPGRQSNEVSMEPRTLIVVGWVADSVVVPHKQQSKDLVLIHTCRYHQGLRAEPLAWNKPCWLGFLKCLKSALEIHQ